MFRIIQAFVLAALLVWLSQFVLAKHRLVQTKLATIRVEEVTKGLEHPWGLAFLPDGRMLVTERPGRLRIVAKDGTASEPLKGLPMIFNEGEAGLYDVTLDPDFTSNHLIYFAFAELGAGGAATSVARGRLSESGLDDVLIIFRQEPKVPGHIHFGGRLLFVPERKLFITLGDRNEGDPAQDLSSGLGKIVRINPDGSAPDDNPFVGQDGKLPEIWSYGHRNVQGATIHPETGELWETELGPLGGDELNIIKPGKNYGWPVVSWGQNNDGTEIPNPATRPEFTDAIYHWTPVISPSGITFYTGDEFPDWKSNLLIAGLSSEAIVRLTLDGNKVTDEERIPMGARMRDVLQGPDGAVYALTDKENGEILRLTIDRPFSY